MLKTSIIFNRFLIEFSSLFPLKMEPTSHIFRTFVENVNFVKIVLPSRRELDFQGFGPPKIKKKRCKNDIKKNIEKNCSEIEFLLLCWPLESFEIAAKSDAEPSLFRDAMEIASKSSQVNGSHRLQSVQRARHMIRSSPSIHPSIHPLICPSSP